MLKVLIGDAFQGFVAVCVCRIIILLRLALPISGNSLHLEKSNYALMKKALCAWALILCMSQLGFSQDKGTYRQTLDKMMEVSGTNASYQGMIKQMIASFRAQQPNASEEAMATMEKTLNEFSMSKLVDKLMPVYQKHLTEKDLKGIIAFYESPAGKNYAAKVPMIMQESMAAGQQWGAEIGAEVVRKMQAGMESSEN